MSGRKRFARWLLWWSVLMSASLHASQKPEYERQIPPPYPRSLYEEGLSGLVIFEFLGHNDGSVTDVKIIDSSHRHFAKSVERTVPKWRLKPWQATAQAPETMSFRQEFYFVHSRERNDPHGWMRRYLRTLSCNAFNKALTTFKAESPSQNLHDLHYITYTFRVLGKAATRHKMTDNQRAELGDEFDRAIPGVVEQCAARPDKRYKQLLPESVRAHI
ncbi:energy transducer TonB [Pseudomonas sp. RC10]|uniref:energy transducer TonB n=1 Tax=Pseudomonas bambusae TaxID=3139142 RepID=UPI003138A8D1